MKAREKTQLEISDVVAKESRDDRDISKKQGLCSIGTAYILSIVPAAHFGLPCLFSVSSAVSQGALFGFISRSGILSLIFRAERTKLKSSCAVCSFRRPMNSL